ncbi:tyrosine-type recombinase/integrase [Streptomyces sp. NPDC058583]|uniref:tyrosine-type recombinase/integrase n=1 Tax=Streptomyces sp. NPDC058583 TaxID=3346549 RepID=UPI00365DF298
MRTPRCRPRPGGPARSRCSRRCCGLRLPRDDWTAARATAGVSGGVHFHDLRHTGNTLASSAGASTRELMTRMGHSKTRAALIYQHMTSDRDQHIAGKLGEMIRQARQARQARQEGASGT